MCKKYAPEQNGNKRFSVGLHLDLVKKIDDLCLTKYRAAFTHGVEGIAENWFASSDLWVIPKWRYFFSVFLGHSRWRSAKMASVDPTLLTVKVKSPDPRNSTNDQKSLPREDFPGLPPPPPPTSGLTLVGA